MSEFRALDVGGQVEETLPEFVGVNGVGVGRVVEEQSHQMTVVLMVLVEVGECLAGLRRVAQLVVFAVFIVHVVHVVLAGIAGDDHARVESCQFQEFIFHGEDASDDDGGACVDMYVAVEDLREAHIHAVGDAAVLFGAQRSQFAQASLCLGREHSDLVEHVVTAWRELAKAVGFGQDVHRVAVLARADEIAGAVAAIVTDIVRRVAFRCLGQLLLGSGVGQIVAGREITVSFDFLFCSLRHGRHREHEQHGNENLSHLYLI